MGALPAQKPLASALRRSRLDPIATMKKLLAEFLGTFGLVFAGTGAIVINHASGGAIGHAGIALTFGLGTRDTTRNLIAGFYARRMFGAGDDLELAGERGTLRSISATQTVLDSGGVTVAVPNSTFLDQVVRSRPEAGAP